MWRDFIRALTLDAQRINAAAGVVVLVTYYGLRDQLKLRLFIRTISYNTESPEGLVVSEGGSD